MKVALYIIAVLIQAAVLVYFLQRGRNLRKQAAPGEDTGNSYEALRTLAIQVTAEQLKLNIPEATTLVYGMVMDWNLNESVMTLAAYITGASSLYLSSGEGVNGGGRRPEVGEAAVNCVVMAQEYLGRAMPVTTTDLPPRGCIRFYLLTNKGVYAAQETMTYFEDASSPWLTLFEMGSGVIEQIRMVPDRGLASVNSAL